MNKRACIVLLFATIMFGSFGRAEVPEITGDQYAKLSALEAIRYVQAFANDYADSYDPQTAQRIRDDFIKTDKRESGLPKGVVDSTGWCDGVLSTHAPSNVSMTKVLKSFFKHEYGPPNAKK